MHDEVVAENQARLESIVRPLIDQGALEPLSDRDADAQLWVDCELCSFIENRFHRCFDPESMTDLVRVAWSQRALAPGERLVDPRRSDFIAAYWILDCGIRAGTIALQRITAGHRFMPVFSLYVFPDRRSGGLAYRTLRAVNRASADAGYTGIRLATHWTWQNAIRHYLFRYGMWAWSFKRSIDFVWARHLPPHVVTVGERRARFAIEHGDRVVELLTASRDDDVLIWNALPTSEVADLCDDITFYARSTFAVALATHGWPLLCAGDNLDDLGASDIGGPGVLAYKIGIFEFLDRRCGFDVRTPRISGLPYEAIARELQSSW